MKEEWRIIFIDGEETNYQVSNMGRVRNTTDRFNGMYKNKILKGQINQHGYMTYRIRLRGKPYAKSGHQLVALSFLPNPQNKPQINHIDSDRLNNNVSNLEWVTSKENNQHKHRMKRDNISTPIYQYDLEGRFIAEYPSMREAGRTVNGQASHICEALYEKQGVMKGYQWRIKESNTPLFIGRPPTKAISWEHRKIIQLTLEGEHVRTFENSEEIKKNFGKIGHVIDVCTNRRKSTLGYKWVYANDYENKNINS